MVASALLGFLIPVDDAIVLVCVMNVTRYDTEHGCCGEQFGGGRTGAAGAVTIFAFVVNAFLDASVPFIELVNYLREVADD